MSPAAGTSFLARALRGSLLLDGAMATYLHAGGGRRGPAAACDELSLSAPSRVRRAHDDYLAAGADIVRTNTFRLASRAHASDAQPLADAAVRLARHAADGWSLRTPDRPRFVAGTLGPADEPGSDERLRAAYRAPLRTLLAGGVDVVLFETCCWPAHAAAAQAAFADAAADTGRTVPVLVSMTLDAFERLAGSGASIDDVIAAIDPAIVVGLGLNCGLGPEGLEGPLAALRRHARLVTCHPSAGLPDAGGQYRIAPDAFARSVASYAAAGLADVVGGCCGTTPAHVAALARAGRQ